MKQDRILLEAVEREAWLDMIEAAPPAFAAAVGLAATRLAGAGGFALRAAPAMQFNRVQGIGVEERASETALDEGLAWLTAHAGPVWTLQLVPQAVPDTWLAARGLAPHGQGWAKFFRAPTPVAAPPTDLDVRVADAEGAGDFASTVQAGFGVPPPFAAWLRTLPERARWRCYVAYDGEVPVAGGALFIDKGLAWLGLGATIASHRGRGAQNAILARRINDAVVAGVRGLVTETGLPGPGEEGAHPSFRNIRRTGFDIAYARANYRPAA